MYVYVVIFSLYNRICMCMWSFFLQITENVVVCGHIFCIYQYVYVSFLSMPPCLQLLSMFRYRSTFQSIYGNVINLISQYIYFHFLPIQLHNDEEINMYYHHFFLFFKKTPFKDECYQILEFNLCTI